MDPVVRAHLAAGDGVVITAHAVRAGITRDHLTDAVAAGELIRLRRGVLVDAASWNSTAPWARHALRARAVAAVWTPEEAAVHALSHHSALAVRGLSFHDVDDRVHVVRTDGGRAMNGGVMAGHHPVEPGWVSRVGLTRAVQPALAVAQVAAAFGAQAGLVSADAALFAKAAETTDLMSALQVPGLGRRTAIADLVLHLADARRESPGESLAWWLFRSVGLPLPELQVEVTTASGEFLGRSDFMWRAQGVIGEFDGALKYDSPAALKAEKWRQDRFVDHGWEVFRMGWDDLARPRVVVDRVHRAFDRARARRGSAAV